MSQHEVLIAQGVLATPLPLARGWRVITRLRNRGLRPLFKVHDAQLLIFSWKTRTIERDALPSARPAPAVDNAALMKDWIVGRIR